MARATWEGQLSFGLITFPVALYSGEKRADLQFDLVDARDQARIRYLRVNEETGEEVPWNQIVRAYTYQDGNYVLLDEKDFERVSVDATRQIVVAAFVKRDEITPIYFEKPYILVPRKGGERAYLVLREALKTTRTYGIARVVIRGRTYLLALMPLGDAIVANRLRFPQELRSLDDFDLPEGSLRQHGVSAEELDAAEKLLLALSSDWTPADYRDEYREALLSWIDKKARVGEVYPAMQEESEPLEEDQPPEDMLDLLERSLEETRGL